MKLPNEGTDGLTRDGFNRITLNVIFKVLRVRKCQIFVFCNFLAIFSTGLKTCLYFLRMQLLVDDIDNLSRDGFD